MSDLTNAEKREVWMSCYGWTLQECNRSLKLDALGEALRRYPDPYEPPILTLENGERGKIVDRFLHMQTKNGTTWAKTTITVSDCMGLGEIAQEYSERTK